MSWESGWNPATSGRGKALQGSLIHVANISRLWVPCVQLVRWEKVTRSGILWRIANTAASCLEIHYSNAQSQDNWESQDIFFLGGGCGTCVHFHVAQTYTGEYLTHWWVPRKLSSFMTASQCPEPTEKVHECTSGVLTPRYQKSQ